MHIQNAKPVARLSNMLLSIIIPTYNRSPFLSELIDKLGTKISFDYEIIVVDDGSTDNTREMLREKKPHRENLKYIYQSNSERGAARNAGTLASTGEYVTFFDSDDLPKENYFELVRQVLLDQKPAWTAFACDHINIINGIQINKRLFKDKKRILWRENYLGCQGVFLRRDIALRYPFSEDRKLSGLEDWELWLRIAKEQTLLWIPTAIIGLRDHPARSMNTIGPDAFEEKILILYRATRETYLGDPRWLLNQNKFLAACNTFVAVHFASTLNKKRYASSLLAAAAILDPTVLTTKRFYATLLKFLKPSKSNTESRKCAEE